MLLVCPNCNARYLAPDAQIGPEGRRVRCARCSHVWRADPPPPPEAAETAGETTSAPAPEAEAAAPPPVEPPADDAPAAAPTPERDGPEGGEGAARPVRVEPMGGARLPAPRERIRRGAGLRGWILFLAIAVAIVAAFFLGRETILSVWPASSKLYEAVGITGDGGDGAPADASSTPTLTVSGLANEWVGEGADLELVIRGSVTNSGAAEQPAQFIRVRLYDRDGAIVRDKRERIDGGPFRPGETRSFAMRFQDPGDVARALPALEPLR